MTKIVNEDYLAKSTNTKLDLKYSENRKTNKRIKKKLYLKMINPMKN